MAICTLRRLGISVVQKLHTCHASCIIPRGLDHLGQCCLLVTLVTNADVHRMRRDDGLVSQDLRALFIGF